jgi:hypothetical protein
MTIHGYKSGGRPTVTIRIFPIAFPAFLPIRRRSHFRSRLTRKSGTQNGMMNKVTGQMSPNRSVFQ